MSDIEIYADYHADLEALQQELQDVSLVPQYPLYPQGHTLFMPQRVWGTSKGHKRVLQRKEEVREEEACD
ncbi:MAG: hypothetical protein M3511_12400 [Deinococcota bacterium]|nr:hypothetical protein [Deinococcota bacterium]